MPNDEQNNGPVLIKDEKIVADPWVAFDATEETSLSDFLAAHANQPVMVPLSVWVLESAQLRAHTGSLGVLLDNTTEPEDISADLSLWSLVAIPFPAFTDGRGFSLARILREQLQYRGEIRAVGDVLHDQLFYMARCGFDAFVVSADVDPQVALGAFRTFSVSYQGAADQRPPIYLHQTT